MDAEEGVSNFLNINSQKQILLPENEEEKKSERP